MLRQIDRAYYQARAQAERQAAAASRDPAIASIHLQLAERYEGLLSGDGVPAAAERLDTWPALAVVTVPGGMAAPK